jgi:hypothetical protein
MTFLKSLLGRKSTPVKEDQFSKALSRLNRGQMAPVTRSALFKVEQKARAA